jgi:hypothetical protein
MSVRLQFEGIRCFSEPQEAVIRPLTLLVGENSSGKTTFLALCQIASSITRGFAREFPFNQPPFLLGAYDQIASYRGGRAGRAKSFSIAVSVGEGEPRGSIRAEFVSQGGQPALREWRLTSGELVYRVVANGGRGKASAVLESSRGKFEFPEARLLMFLDFWPPHEFVEDQPKLKDMKAVFSKSDWNRLWAIWKSARREFGRGTYALAPIRTSPQRTYDPVSAEPKPEGSHVPMLLARLSHAATKGQWAALVSALKEFGSNSGLFEEIEVIRKGKKESDPFQIGVRSGGPLFNLVDVGYGVSQALPILVDAALRSGPGETFLLQQPEVHLHPRAQAEVGSFFARLAGKKRRFVIETHSDYLVDRIRMEVRKGEHLKPEDVSFLYFERQKHGALIHNLELDKSGSITNPPSGFRQFFLDEERGLLGV